MTLFASPSRSDAPRHAARRRDRADHGRDDSRRARRGGLGRRDRNDRGPGASGANPLVRHAGEPRWRRAAGRCRQAWSAGIVCSRRRRPSPVVVDFVATMVAAVVFFLLNLLLAGGAACASNRPVDLEVVSSATSRNRAASWLALAPLAWLMSTIYSRPVVGDAAVRGAAVHDPGGVPALRRDARDVHPDDRRARRGRRQARPVHRQAQPAGQGDRGRHRARDARLATPSSRRSSGAACSTTSARSACRTTSC